MYKKISTIIVLLVLTCTYIYFGVGHSRTHCYSCSTTGNFTSMTLNRDLLALIDMHPAFFVLTHEIQLYSSIVYTYTAVLKLQLVDLLPSL